MFRVPIRRRIELFIVEGEKSDYYEVPLAVTLGLCLRVSIRKRVEIE